MRRIALRLTAAFSALTWLVLPGFGLADLMVSWDPDWPVVLEASWGLFMTVLVAGSFLTVAFRPRASAPALVTLAVTLGAWTVSAVAGREWELLGFVALLAVETVLVLPVPGRERLRPVRWSVSPLLVALAAAAAVPGTLHALAMYRLNRLNAFEADGDITMGIDHYAVQGALAVALVVLCLLAACWPRGRRHLGISVGLVAVYLGIVSLTHAGYDAALGRIWSVLAIVWGAAVAVLSVTGSRSEPGQLRGEVVEAERAL